MISKDLNQSAYAQIEELCHIAEYKNRNTPKYNIEWNSVVINLQSGGPFTNWE